MGRCYSNDKRKSETALSNAALKLEVTEMASLSLQHVYKKYEGGVVAVSDFNLEIADKEFIILVGPSGCGK